MRRYIKCNISYKKVRTVYSIHHAPSHNKFIDLQQLHMIWPSRHDIDFQPLSIGGTHKVTVLDDVCIIETLYRIYARITSSSKCKSDGI